MNRILAGLAAAAFTVTAFAAAPAVAAAAPLTKVNGDRFTVAMPGSPERMSNSVEIGAGTVATQAYTAMDDGVIYSISTADYPPAVVAKRTIEEFLDEARNGLANQLKGTLKSEVPIRIGSASGGQPGREFMIASDNGEVKARAAMVGNRLYTLLVLYNASVGAPNRDAFLMSLKLKP